MLKTESLQKQFGSLTAVDSVSLEIEDGEFASIIGPNGAGKTTLFNLITGSIQPTNGQVIFDEEDITNLEPYEIARLGCSRSFQITSIFPELTVHENIRVMAQINSEERSSLFKRKKALTDPMQKADELIELLNLSHVRDREAKQLSHGHKRNLEIGLSLATDPKLLMLDEPTAGMSVEETRETIDLFNKIREDYTIVLVEHDMDVVLELSDRVMVLDRGAIIANGPPDEIRQDKRVKEAYFGDETYV